MTVAPGDVIRVTARLNYGQVSEMQNVYHVSNVGASGVDDLDFTQACADELDAAYTFVASLQPLFVKYNTIEFFNVTQDTPMVPQDWPVLVEGDTAGESLPLQAAGLVSFRTGTKNSIGRKYISGIDEIYGDSGGILNVTAVSSLTLFAEVLIPGFAVDSQPMQFGNYREATSTFIEWTSFIVRDVFKTQRRRVLGTGA